MKSSCPENVEVGHEKNIKAATKMAPLAESCRSEWVGFCLFIHGHMDCLLAFNPGIRPSQLQPSGLTDVEIPSADGISSGR